MVDIEKIKKLREETELSIGECKKALENAGGELEEAKKLLARKQSKLASKRRGRSTEQGAIDSYIHNNNKVGVLLDLRSETDFVARSDKFKELAHILCLQIASMSPRFVSREQVPEEVLREKKKVWRTKYKKEDKPDRVVDKIIEGKVEKFFEEVCLLEQPFIKDEDKTVKEMVDSYVAEFGENIVVHRFTRYEIE